MMLFLVIGPTTRQIILGIIEDVRLRLAVATPLSYFLIVIIVGSAVVSAAIMIFWPKTNVEPVQYHVTRRYLGPSGEVDAEPALLGPWLQLLLHLAQCLLPVRRAALVEVRLRDMAASAVLKRQLRA